jgi:hypothetical protein
MSSSARFDAQWNRTFAELEAYVAEHGDTRDIALLAPRLNTWLGTQRRVARSGNLSLDRRAKLVALGIPYQPAKNEGAYRRAWYAQFEKLQKFHTEHGHVRVPSRSTSYRWLLEQKRKKATLAEDLRAKLLGLGVKL